MECIRWKEKAKEQWLKDRDANSRFFHLTTIIHRKTNFIHFLLDDDNTRLVDYEMISQWFISFYSCIFSSVNPSFPSDFQNLIQPSVNNEVNRSLSVMPSIADVHKALFSMENNKSPGPDGMNLIFFKTYWHIIGKDIHAAVCDFFTKTRLSKAANHTFIVLISKKLTTNRVEQFVRLRFVMWFTKS